MPIAPRIAGLRRLAVLRAVGDLENFAISVQPVMRRRCVVVERTEALRKGEMLLGYPIDAAENDDVMAVPGLTNSVDLRFGKIARNINAANFRIDGGSADAVL